MIILLDTLLVTLILTGFLLLGSSRLGASIRISALQGIMTGLLPLALEHGDLFSYVSLLGVAVIGLKGYIFPRLLLSALRESDTSREVQPFVGYVASLFFGILFLMGSFWLDTRLNLPVHSSSDLLVPVAFSLISCGLFLIVARRTAMGQVIGYLVLENGIYCFGLAVVSGMPLLLELGVLMDIFVAVFVMGIAIYHINREFDHIDADRLSALKG
ncbi:MAG: hydrogenase [Kiritimatiellae bacterium]|nr:hydrogenase [Kiritimatiellia bacterium]